MSYKIVSTCFNILYPPNQPVSQSSSWVCMLNNKNSPILKQSVSIKMLIQSYHSLISNSTAWCSTPTLLLICSQFVGKLIMHCWFAHHDTHSPVKLSSFRTTQNSIGKEETCTCDIGDPPISARSTWYLFWGGTLWQKKIEGNASIFATNDSKNDVQWGVQVDGTISKQTDL